MSGMVRRLGPGDLPAMRALNDLFARAFEDPDRYAARQPADAYLARLLAQGHVMVLTADAEGAVVGGLVAYRLDKLEQARSEWYLYDLTVDAAFRRRGLATALVDGLRREAAATDAVVFVQADPEDDAAVALYTKLGTRQAVFHFDLEPGVSAPPHA